MGKALDALIKENPDGIPVEDPEKIVDIVKAASDHVDHEELRKGLAALSDAIATKNKQKRILALSALVIRSGLEIAIPG